jgi:hypothetical protein
MFFSEWILNQIQDDGLQKMIIHDWIMGQAQNDASTEISHLLYSIFYLPNQIKSGMTATDASAKTYFLTTNDRHKSLNARGLLTRRIALAGCLFAKQR